MADKVKETTSTTTTTVTPAEAATMEQYKASPYYQNLNIQQLQEQAAGYAMDDATLRGQAENLYKPTYDAELESIRQGLATQNQAYDAQKASLQQTYNKQREQTNQSYNESAVDLNNTLTKRGLGRSSLVSTQGTYLENKRQQALADIGTSESTAYSDIEAKKALAAQQAAESEKRLSSSYAAQIESRITELRKENQSALTNLQLQIATLQQQGYQAYQDWLAQQKQIEITQQNADREYELALRQQQLAEDEFAWQKSKSSGGSSYSYNSGNPGAANPEDVPSADHNLQQYMQELMGNNNRNGTGNQNVQERKTIQDNARRPAVPYAVSALFNKASSTASDVLSKASVAAAYINTMAKSYGK